jgi:hypothetical protein
MRRIPLLDFQRAAEARGYPALLIVSMLCLGLVVASVGLLALTPAVWALALALVSVIVALAILAGAMDAAFSDRDEPARGRAGLPTATPEDSEAVVRYRDLNPQPGGRDPTARRPSLLEPLRPLNSSRACRRPPASRRRRVLCPCRARNRLARRASIKSRFAAKSTQPEPPALSASKKYCSLSCIDWISTRSSDFAATARAPPGAPSRAAIPLDPRFEGNAATLAHVAERARY